MAGRVRHWIPGFRRLRRLHPGCGLSPDCGGFAASIRATGSIAACDERNTHAARSPDGGRARATGIRGPNPRAPRWIPGFRRLRRLHPGYGPGIRGPNPRAPRSPDEAAKRRNPGIAAGFIIALLALAVTACGYQLRGTFAIGPELQPMYVDAGGAMRRSLIRSLDFAGVERTDSRSEAASTLRIVEFDRSRDVISTDIDGRADEYEITAYARWRLDGPRREGDTDLVQRPLIAENRLEARRSYRYDAEAVLAQDEIEDTIRREVLDELTDLILFRLQAWSP